MKTNMAASKLWLACARFWLVAALVNFSRALSLFIFYVRWLLLHIVAMSTPTGLCWTERARERESMLQVTTAEIGKRQSTRNQLLESLSRVPGQQVIRVDRVIRCVVRKLPISERDREWECDGNSHLVEQFKLRWFVSFMTVLRNISTIQSYYKKTQYSIPW